MRSKQYINYALECKINGIMYIGKGSLGRKYKCQRASIHWMLEKHNVPQRSQKEATSSKNTTVKAKWDEIFKRIDKEINKLKGL